MRPAVEGSVLDSLGAELIGVISPVSICMLIVVLLISSLSSPSASSSATVAAATTAATLVYSESPSDSPGRKFAGALLNAAAFVVLVTAVTFALVVLYYYRCTGFLKGYMRLSAFLVLASMGGPIVLSLLHRLALPLDAISALILLFNSAAIGAHAVLSPAAPVLLRQAYLVALAVCVAAWFARLPEWTTWALLLALAAYDLAAVLCPRGPLRILVELAASRDDDLPALVYEARPAAASVSHAVAAVAGSSVELQPVNSSANPRPNSNPNYSNPHNSSSNSNPEQTVLQIVNLEAAETSPLMSNELSSDSGSGGNRRHSDGGAGRTEGERYQLEEGSSNSLPDDSDSESEMDRGIRLGLGDFVFYSVLVGRAAMYDLMTVYACYLAIISGLACTLVLLSVFRHALPALPISIALGTGFYFLTRVLMEPFVLGASSSLVMF